VNHQARSGDEDNTPQVEPEADVDRADERPELKLDAEDNTPEEAGYGYGV
jgi:hypothetical protein